MAESLTFKFSGDTAKGRNYVGFAKAAVADLHNLMELGDLNSYGLSKIFDDGTAIHVKTDYGISVVNIHCPIITEEVKPIIEEEFYQVTSFVVGVFPTTQAGIRLKLFDITSSGLMIASECTIKGLTISDAADMRVMQCIWDVVRECYQLFIGNYSGEHPHVLQYPVGLDGTILEVETLPGYTQYQPQYSLLPNQYASIELRETDLTADKLCYLYYGTQSYALLDTEFKVLREVEDPVEGSWVQPYYAFKVDRYPTYSLPQPPDWNTSILKTVLDDGTMVVFHGWITNYTEEGQYLREWRIIYEDHKKHTAQEWLMYRKQITSAGIGMDADGIRFSISNRTLQVEDTLWYFEDNEYYTGVGNRWNPNRRKNLNLRIADIANPLAYVVAEEYTSTLIGSALYINWTWTSGGGWIKTEQIIKAPTGVVMPMSMVYCKEEKVILISKVRWDNTGIANWTVRGSPDNTVTYDAAPNGSLTSLIDIYDIYGKLLNRTELETVTVPSVWSYSLVNPNTYVGIQQPIPGYDYDALSRLSKLGYSKIKKLIQL